MPKIDLQFRLSGSTIPVDHAYGLFSAISKILPEIHGDPEIGIHPVNGFFAGNRLLRLTSRSRLTIRVTADRIKSLLALSGRSLKLGKYVIHVGTPDTRMLAPSPRLYSRLVVIKGFMQPENFLAAVKRQLIQLDCHGEPHLIPQPKIVRLNQGNSVGSRSPYLRRTIRIGRKEIVGFALRIDGLTSLESILLQETGIGGRRHFGCGIFIADKKL